MLSIKSVISESLLHPNRFQYSNPPFFFDEINHIWIGGGEKGAKWSSEGFCYISKTVQLIFTRLSHVLGKYLLKRKIEDRLFLVAMITN